MKIGPEGAWVVPNRFRHLSFGPVYWEKLRRDLRLRGLRGSAYIGSAAEMRFPAQIFSID